MVVVLLWLLFVLLALLVVWLLCWWRRQTQKVFVRWIVFGGGVCLFVFRAFGDVWQLCGIVVEVCLQVVVFLLEQIELLACAHVGVEVGVGVDVCNGSVQSVLQLLLVVLIEEE